MSAINAKFSVYSAEERLAQTLETIKSVRTHIPNAVICLADCGVPGISDEISQQLNKDVDFFIDFSNDENVLWIQQNIQVQDVVKNLTELGVSRGFFDLALEEGWFADCERVFKISGRYTLNDKFHIEDYDNPLIGDKYVFGKRMLSQFAHGITGMDQQYMVRLYSLSTNSIPEFIELLDTMSEDMQERVNAGGYIDIEHLFYKFLPPENVIEFDRTGVTGLLAPTGVLVEN